MQGREGLRRAVGRQQAQQQHASLYRQKILQLLPRPISEFSFCFHRKLLSCCASFITYSAVSVSNAYAIEVRAGVRGGGVRVTGRAGLADNVALDGGEGRLRRQIGTALEIIRSRVHA